MGDDYDPDSYFDDDGAGDSFEAGGDAAGGEYHFEYADEDATDMERAVRSAKDGMILAIDCRKNMFKEYPHADKDSSSRTPFSLAMNIASAILRRKVITSSRTQISVVLWGTREALNTRGFDHLYVLFPLDTPTAAMIAQLDTYAEFKTTGKQLFDERIGSQTGAGGDQGTLEAMFWLGSQMFDEAKFTQADSQRVWVFTNDDDPCKDSRQFEERTITRARDFEKVGRQLTLWTMTPKNDRSFNPSTFWNGVLLKSKSTDPQPLDEEDEDEDDGSSRLIYVSSDAEVQEIIQANRRKEFPKRTLASFPFVLAPNLEMGVKMYAIVLETKKPNPVQLENATALPLKTTTRYLCVATASTLTPDEIVTTARYGGMGRIAFSSDDKRRVKRFAPASLTLLGFKPLNELQIWQNVRAPYLLRPDEKSVKGSNKAFVALLSAAIDQNMFGVARMITNKSAAPKLVALVPQAEQLTEDGEVVTPMGFLVVVLPYADDIRTPSFPEPFAEANSDQVEKAKRLVQRLSNNSAQGPFDPRDYENPALQKFWVNLEAIALDKQDQRTENEWREDRDDTLRLPNAEELIFDEEFVNIAQAFTDSYGGPGEVEDKKPARKRAAPAEKKSPAKRSKSAKGEEDDMDVEGGGEVDWAALRKKGLNKLTVDELKGHLRNFGLPLSGAKAILIERLESHLDKEQL